MLNLSKNLGIGSLAVIVVTFVLFAVALFEKGFTQDLLLEAAIFLVSVKLIIMTYRNSQGVEAIQVKLDLILTEERHLETAIAALRAAKAGEREATNVRHD
jgi:hypothetical protein